MAEYNPPGFTRDIVKIKIIYFATLCIALCASIALAQTSKASIRGSLSNPSKARLSNVVVELLRIDTGDRRSATTDERGEFIISLLAPGSYQIEVQQSGFRKYVQPLTLAVNQEARLDIQLEIGPIAEEMIVNAPRVPLRKDSAAIGTVIDNKKLSGLPLDGRNFLDLRCWCPARRPRLWDPPARLEEMSRSTSTALVKTRTTSCSMESTT